MEDVKKDKRTKFSDRLYKTKGVRFIAYRRLKNKQRASTFTLSILSVYAIFLTVASVVYPEMSKFREFQVASIIVPVFILILSQHEASKEHAVSAERMRRSAQKIQELYLRSISQCRGDDCSDSKLEEDYTLILSDFSVDHEPVDYKYFNMTSRNKKRLDIEISRFEIISAWMRYNINVYGGYATLVLFPLVVYLCLYIYYTVIFQSLSVCSIIQSLGVFYNANLG